LTYIFNGFFAAADELVLQSALSRWPYCTGRVIDHPAKSYPIDGVSPETYSFVGFGVKWDSSVDIFEDPKLRPDLLAWSTLFPTINFVWVDVECWGGGCFYGGVVFQNGTFIATEPISDDEALIRLVSYLGIELGISPWGVYFDPFTRSYFGEK
jgi:hypothetical protein